MTSSPSSGLRSNLHASASAALAARCRLTPAWTAGPLAVLTLAVLLLAACESLRPAPRSTVPSGAVEAFADARAWARLGRPQDRERAREAARLAQALAPDWVAPRRMLDDFLREELLGLEALAVHRRSLEQMLAGASDAGPREMAAALYLAGRLEGDAGFGRFERARLVDAEFAWAYHGLAYVAERRGDHAEARQQQRTALALARDSFERSYFSSALARIEDSAGRSTVALELLQKRLADPETAPPDWVELAVQLAEIELSLVLRAEGRRGYERALELVRSYPLTDSELLSLVARIRQLSVFDDPGALELQLALAAQEGPLRDRLRAEILLGQRATPLALGLFSRAQGVDGIAALGGPLLRRARFAAGLIAEAVEGWRAELPAVVLDDSGLPRNPRLARVVRAARELDAQHALPSEAAATSDADLPRDRAGDRARQLAALGEALIAAGWYEEARAVASQLAASQLDEALVLEAQAAAGLGFLHGIDRLMRQIDMPAVPLGVAASSGSGAELAIDRLYAQRERAAGNLDAMLLAIAPLVSQSGEFLGGETDIAALERELISSPRLIHGFVGALVHPGPYFSQQDFDAGRGKRGDAVPGLARVLAAFGRFGVFGKLVGAGGPDGTVLQVVLVEDRSGEHLGVPWSGTVAWCEGADVLTRAGRRGASIAGAALHEGYWIDLDRVRNEWARWRELEERLADELEGPRLEGPRLERALSTRGLLLETSLERPEARRAERRSPGPLLGAAELVRLAVLVDRRALSPSEPLVSFDEIVRNTSIHEEGHLCDRTRFLPLRENMGRALAFLAKNAFSPQRISRRLEYRAQLVALAEAPDPRVPLVEVLSGAESGASLTPHAAGYKELLIDLLALLETELEAHPESWPELDPDRMLAHQLHRIGPGRYRELTRELARREGLTVR